MSDEFENWMYFLCAIFAILSLVFALANALAVNRIYNKTEELIKLGYMGYDSKTGELVINKIEQVCKHEQ